MPDVHSPYTLLTGYKEKPRLFTEYKLLIHTLKKYILTVIKKQNKREMQGPFIELGQSHPQVYAAEVQPRLLNAVQLFEVLLPVLMAEMSNMLVADSLS